MTPTACADHPSLHSARPQSAAAARAAAGPLTTLDDAVRAVNDHRRGVELRRMVHAARHSAAADDWLVPVPRSRLAALEQQAHDAALLRSLLDSGPAIAVPFSALPPYTLREVPPSLARAIGQPDVALPARPLARLFVGADAARLQQALCDADAATLTAHLRRADGHALRCSVHLAPADAHDPDWRWACIVRLPQPPAAQPLATERHLPAQPSQRPRLEARPAPSA